MIADRKYIKMLSEVSIIQVKNPEGQPVSTTRTTAISLSATTRLSFVFLGTYLNNY